MNNIILAVVVSVALTGCGLFSTKPRDITMVTASIETCAKPPRADKIIMRNVDFEIVKDEFGIYWIAVTPKFYENLAVNMKEIIQHIKQKNAIVKYYKSCHKEKEDDTVKGTE